MPLAKMTSRERVRAAICCEPVDRVPCAPWFFDDRAPGRKPWNSGHERCQYFADELGADGYVDIGLAAGHTPSVTSEFRFSDGGQILHKVFHTPDGDLAASIRINEKLPVQDDIHLASDFNPPLFVKPWIQTIEDVECLKHLCLTPAGARVSEFHKTLEEAQTLAEKFGFPIIGHVGMGLTWLIQLMGGEAAMFASMDSPDLIERFMDIEHELNMRKIEIMLDAGVDIILRNGFYETCDFWNPKQVKDIVLSRVNEEAKLVHAMGGVLIYTVCTGIVPLLDLYLESEIDCFIKYETKLMGQRLQPIAEKLAGKKGLWGGLSDCEDLGRATLEETRQAVRQVFEFVGSQGMILSASPSIKPERPSENVAAMFDEWRKLR